MVGVVRKSVQAQADTCGDLIMGRNGVEILFEYSESHLVLLLGWVVLSELGNPAEEAEFVLLELLLEEK